MKLGNFTTKAPLFVGATTVALMLASVPAYAGVITFTDQSAFEAAVGTATITENFDGDASDFGKDSTGNPVGSGITVDVNGPAKLEDDGSADTGPTGLTGQGQFQSEVDSIRDVLDIDLNFAAPLFGFGFEIQNDSQNNAGSLNLEEIAILIAGESFILSDIFGATNSADGKKVSDAESSGPLFFGFTSDTAFSSLTFLHGDFVAPGGVQGNVESFFLNTAVLAPEISAIPLPAGVWLLLSGLGGIAALTRRNKRAA